jgi:hypothetical protein
MRVILVRIVMPRRSRREAGSASRLPLHVPHFMSKNCRDSTRAAEEVLFPGNKKCRKKGQKGRIQAPRKGNIEHSTSGEDPSSKLQVTRRRALVTSPKLGNAPPNLESTLVDIAATGIRIYAVGVLVYRLGHGPLKAERRVRFPCALPISRIPNKTNYSVGFIGQSWQHRQLS